MPADGPAPIPLATARRAAVRLLRALSSSPDVLRLGVGGPLRRMEPRVPAVEIVVSTLEELPGATARIEAAVEALAFVEDGRIEPGLPLDVRVVPEADWPAAVGPEPAVAPGVLEVTDVRGAFHLHVRPGLGSHPLPTVAARAAEEGYAWIVAVAPPGDLARLVADALDGPPVVPDPDAPADRPPLRIFLAARLTPDEAEAPLGAPALLVPGTDVGATVAAMSHPRVKVLAHPATTPGAWWEREADDVQSWQQVLDAAAAHDVALEFSGAPRAAWLPDAVHGLARERGIAMMPGADARTPNDIDDLLCAVGPLRSAGCTAARVPATWDAERFAAWWHGDTDR